MAVDKVSAALDGDSTEEDGSDGEEGFSEEDVSAR